MPAMAFKNIRGLDLGNFFNFLFVSICHCFPCLPCRIQAYSLLAMTALGEAVVVLLHEDNFDSHC